MNAQRRVAVGGEAAPVAIQSVSAELLPDERYRKQLLALRCACTDVAGREYGRLVDATTRLKRLGTSHNQHSNRLMTNFHAAAPTAGLRWAT